MSGLGLQGQGSQDTGSELGEDGPAPCSQQRQREGARFPPQGRAHRPYTLLGLPKALG